MQPNSPEIERLAALIIRPNDPDFDACACRGWAHGQLKCPCRLRREEEERLALLAARRILAAGYARRDEVIEECAKVAEGWKSSLRPGSTDRLNGHNEAACDIAAAIRGRAKE